MTLIYHVLFYYCRIYKNLRKTSIISKLFTSFVWIGIVVALKMKSSSSYFRSYLNYWIKLCVHAIFLSTYNWPYYFTTCGLLFNYFKFFENKYQIFQKIIVYFNENCIINRPDNTYTIFILNNLKYFGIFCILLVI